MRDGCYILVETFGWKEIQLLPTFTCDGYLCLFYLVALNALLMLILIKMAFDFKFNIYKTEEYHLLI